MASVQMPGEAWGAPAAPQATAETVRGCPALVHRLRGRGLRQGALLCPGQIISALEEDPVAQKMQLACRLQQVAALVENKVTDL